MKNDCLDVIERYMKRNSVGKISSSWQSTLGFDLISNDISFKNQIYLQKLSPAPKWDFVPCNFVLDPNVILFWTQILGSNTISF